MPLLLPSEAREASGCIRTVNNAHATVFYLRRSKCFKLGSIILETSAPEVGEYLAPPTSVINSDILCRLYSLCHLFGHIPDKA